ncbi:unnamed protein product, partial [Mesorhabditis belari]|uniref:Trafficking protein particle complex subunit 6B n=1 Tax=Mesorhabditis belari TaxID=2138241 RepID=A0AAF3FS32_9BILA
MSLPFDLLHMEMVRYGKEKEAVARADYPKEVLEGLDKATSSLVYKALASRNAETNLESIGLRTGFLLAERLCRDLPRISTELEIMKFICKEFWISVFGKQVDNLRTNHQGVYVVQDNRFPCLTSFSDGTQYVKDAAIYLCFPCGVVRGALQALGIQALVTPTTDQLPSVKFHIHIKTKLT